MNWNLTKWGLFLLLLCGFSLQSFGQTRKISEQEFIKIEDTADQKTTSENYRKKSKSLHFHHISDKKPYLQTNEIVEVVANSYHKVKEEINEKGITRTETIEIKNRKYQKINKGRWKDVTKANNNLGGFSLGGEIDNKRDTEQIYLGKQTINGQTVDVYEQKIKTKYENGLGLLINENKIWIDDKGRYLKTESKVRFDEKNLSQITVDYEYDSNIKIIAPKIK